VLLYFISAVSTVIRLLIEVTVTLFLAIARPGVPAVQHGLFTPGKLKLFVCATGVFIKVNHMNAF